MNVINICSMAPIPIISSTDFEFLYVITIFVWSCRFWCFSVPTYSLSIPCQVYGVNQAIPFCSGMWEEHLMSRYFFSMVNLLYSCKLHAWFSGIIYTSPCNISIHGQPIWYGAQSTHQHSFASEECLCCKFTFMTRVLLRFYYLCCFVLNELVLTTDVHR
jgi:hypothetical protein